MLYREIRKSGCVGARGALALLGALRRGQRRLWGTGDEPWALLAALRAAQAQHTWGTAEFSTQLMGKALTICLTCTTQGTWQGTAGHREKCPLGCPGDTSWCCPPLLEQDLELV